jgi:hypothetical protein
MLLSTHQRFKQSFTFLLYSLVLILLSACSSGDSTLTTQTGNKDGVSIPRVVSEALPENGTLSAFIRVDGGPRQAMSINGDTASITLGGVSLGEHTITMEFEFVFDSNPDQPLNLASASQAINVVAGENPPLTFANYDTESFDADGDGISNLAELSNNTNPFAGIVVSPASGNTSEDGSTATFTVVLSGQPTSDVVIGISSSDTTEGTVNIDTIAFDTTNWDTPQPVTVTGVNDSFDDGDQNYHIDFAAAVSNDNDFDGLQPPRLNLINVDNDTSGVQPPEVTLSINTSSPLAENGGSANLTASLSAVSEVPVTVNLLYSGTATPGTDYTKSDSIVISAGNTLAQVAITAVDDAEDESNETIIVDIDSVIDGFEVTTQQVTASIADDDIPVINFSNAAQTVSEIVGSVSLAVTLDRPGVVDITVPYTVSGTATDGSVDHDLNGGSITFPAGQTSTQVSFNIIDDSEIEPDETVVITLGNPSNAALGTNIEHTVTIVSDDYSVSGTVTGYATSGLVLQNNNSTLPVSGSIFTFPTALADGSSYNVTISTQPAGQICVVNNASGTISSANIINVEVSCQVTLNITSTKPKILTFRWADLSEVTSYRLLVNPDGNSGYTQVGVDTMSTNLDIEIPVHFTDWVNAKYMLEAYNGTTLVSTSDAVEILDAMINSIGYFKASNTGGQAAAHFGFSVALSGDGNTMAIGSPRESSAAIGVNGDQIYDCYADPLPINCAAFSGAVYVYTRNSSGIWGDIPVYIKASNTESSGSFGISVSLSNDGNTLAVGASAEDSASTGINGNQNCILGDNCAIASGAVYVYSRNAVGVWNNTPTYIKAINTGANDEFGISVSLSGDGTTLVVGAYKEDSAARSIDNNPIDDCDTTAINCATDSGAVYVYNYDGIEWSPSSYIKASNTDAYDYFGYSVSISENGNTLAVGAYKEDSAATGVNGSQTNDCANTTPINCALESGAVYVYTRDGTGVWNNTPVYIKASNTDPVDRFGKSVSLSGDGNTLVVGAMHEASNATGINGDQTNNLSGLSGAVYIFSRDSSGNWGNSPTYIKALNTRTGWFGQSVRLSGDGNHLIVGAPQENGPNAGIISDNLTQCVITDPITCPVNTGSAYVYSRDASGVWSTDSPIYYIKASNPGEHDLFGTSVSISKNGNIIAIGAESENSGATGINGNQTNDCDAAVPVNCTLSAGAVYLY